MDELLLRLVWYLLRGLFLGIRFVVALAYRGLRRLGSRLRDQVPARDTAQTRAIPARSSLPSPATPAVSGLAGVRCERAIVALLDKATAAASLCANEEQNERFAETFSGYIVGGARAAQRRLKAGTPEAVRAAESIVEEITFVFEVVSEMAAQRRDEDKLLLLGDADALAEACYRPLFEFARGSGIRLRSSRAATFLGDKDLALFVGLIPTGLAPIILPSAWSTEIGWWPALAHEIGHDFHASVIGFDDELRQRFRLPLGGGLPRPRAGLTTADLGAAYAAWLAEIFADLFGTMMLGAAYVTTMIWSFSDPKEPQNVVTVRPAAGASGHEGEAWAAYEEHPPAHLRVVLGCRLLSAIGFPLEADKLEEEWRRRHGSPEALLVPTRAGTWYRVDERAYVAYGETLVTAIYQQGFTSLAGFALRSIPGLDLGPGEHRAALDARDAYFAGNKAATRDPRSLIAGAVFAWKERPALSARVLRAARATIASVGVSRRQLRLRAERDGGAAGGLDPAAAEMAAWREGFLLGEAFAPPRGSRIVRRL